MSPISKCPSPAAEAALASLPAPAGVGQWVGTSRGHLDSVLRVLLDECLSQGMSLEDSVFRVSSAIEALVVRPSITDFLGWLYAELDRLDGMPSSPDYPSYRECQAALRVCVRFVAHCVGR